MLTKLFSIIKTSTLDANGKYSHTRVSSYFILGSILTSCAVFITIDLVNAIIMWRKAQTYTIPWDHVALFALILGHHLVLLGLKKSSDDSITGSGGKITNSKNKKRNDEE
jgi:hypothetical protein